MTHTPGPWQVNGSLIYGPDPHRELIAQVLSGDGRLVADRDILTASPDMLRALELTKKYLEALKPALNTMAREVLGDIITDQIDPAIAKARGR